MEFPIQTAIAQWGDVYFFYSSNLCGIFVFQYKISQIEERNSISSKLLHVLHLYNMHRRGSCGDGSGFHLSVEAEHDVPEVDHETWKRAD